MMDGSLMLHTNAIFAVGVNPCVDIFNISIYKFFEQYVMVYAIEGFGCIQKHK